MIDTDEKKYVADLCSAVYGYYPRDVYAVQILQKHEVSTAYSVSPSQDFGFPVFVKSYCFQHSKKVSGMENFVSFGVSVTTSKTMQVFNETNISLMCNSARVTSSETGDVDLIVVGYRCEK